MSTPTLRPGTLTLGEHFSGAFATYKSRLWLFLGLAFAPMLGAILIALVLGGVIMGVTLSSSGRTPGAGPVVLISVVAVVAIFALVLFQYRCLAMSSLATRDVAAGHHPAWPDLWQRTRGFTGRFLLLALAFGAVFLALYAILAFIIVLPFIQLILQGNTSDANAWTGFFGAFALAVVLMIAVGIVALILQVRWLYLIPVMGIEQTSGFDGLRRSWQITRGAFWPTLGYYLLMSLAIGAPIYLVSIVTQFAVTPISISVAEGVAPSGAAIAMMVLATLLQMAVSVLVQPFSAIFVTVMYLSRLRALAGEPPSIAYQQAAWGQPYGAPGAPSPEAGGQQPPYGQPPHGEQPPTGEGLGDHPTR